MKDYEILIEYWNTGRQVIKSVLNYCLSYVWYTVLTTNNKYYKLL